MIVFEDVSIRNFLSFGNCPQTLDLKKKNFNVIIGKNLDKTSEDDGNSNGVGKAQPLYSKVLTDKGWKRMGELTTETKVITPKGKIAQILGIYYKGEKDVYRVYFKDGRYTDCCNEHLWKIWTGIESYKDTHNHKSWCWRVVDTNTLIDYLNRGYKSFQKNIYVPLVEDVFIEQNKTLDISPYIMGVLLGDGSISNGTCEFTTMDDTIVQRVNNELLNGYELISSKRNIKSKASNYRIVKKDRSNNHFGSNYYHNELKRFNLWGKHSWDKFIPNEYKNLSKQQTIELLQGLFDTDGYIGKNGSVGFSTVSKELAEDIQYLIWKLGGLCKIREDKNYFVHNGIKKYGRLTYNLSIRIKNPMSLVSLERKKERCVNYQYNDSLKNRIDRIEYIGKIPCQCIYIDDDEHLYVTDNFIVTHNTTVMQAIHYALYGKSIGNKITLPTLVNNINKKNMEVVLHFTKDDVRYTIERGRNPTYLHLYKNGDEIIDESLGDSRETQDIIEQIIGMNSDLFCQTVLLTCQVPIFMEQSTANQKMIIEKILGVDIITEKIQTLKEKIKDTKNSINNESFKVETLKTQRETNLKNYQSQLEVLNKSKEEWENGLSSKKQEYNSIIDLYKNIDFDKEKEIIDSWNNYLEDKKSNDEIQSKIDSCMNKGIKLSKEIEQYTNVKNQLSSVNIEEEKKKFEEYDRIKSEETEYIKEKVKIDSLLSTKSKNEKEMLVISNSIKEKREALENVKDNICPTCGQVTNSDVSTKYKEKIQKEIDDLMAKEHSLNMEIMEIVSETSDFAVKKFEYPVLQFKSRDELMSVETSIKNCDMNIENIMKQLNDLVVEKESYKLKDIKEPEAKSSFNNLVELETSKLKYENAKKELEELSKEQNNPYDSQIENVSKLIKENDIEINESVLSELLNDQEHNELLLKLLNSPSSYIRKAILDKSLDFLNSKIRMYLAKLGSLHIVKFNNDMTIDITSNGLEFGTVSSGEMGRISIALTLAFREVWENLNSNSTNLLMIDEIIDRFGLDEPGIQMCVKCIRETVNKNILLVSHNPIVKSMESNKINIVKENGFTTIVK